jgi:glutamine synthetase
MPEPGSLSSFLVEHPDVQRVEAFVCDVNGVARGKWLSREKAEAIWGKGLPMPRSVFALWSDPLEVIHPH